MDKERREGNFLIKILSFPSFINIFVRLSSCAICKKMLKKKKKKNEILTDETMHGRETVNFHGKIIRRIFQLRQWKNSGVHCQNE